MNRISSANAGNVVLMLVLCVASLWIMLKPNPLFTGHRTQFVFDHDGSLQQKTVNDIETECENIERAYRIDVILLVSGPNIQTQSSLDIQANTYIAASFPNRVASALYLNKPTIVVEFFDTDGTGSHSRVQCTGNASSLGLSTSEVARVFPKNLDAYSIDSATVHTIANVHHRINFEFVNRTWRGRQLGVNAVALVLLVLFHLFLAWIIALAWRMLDGRPKQWWQVPLEYGVGFTVTIGAFKAIEYFGGWPEV